MSEATAVADARPGGPRPSELLPAEFLSDEARQEGLMRPAGAGEVVPAVRAFEESQAANRSLVGTAVPSPGETS